VRTAELCAGYGGLALAAKILHPNSNLAWVCETDPNAIKILNHNYSDIPNHGDITKIKWENVEPIDQLMAGFPPTILHSWKTSWGN
jgi:DNA (cytosine-5)-methyltransferase 1